MSYFQLIAPKQQWVDANGNPYSGGKLFTYDAGTSTKKTTYTTDAGAVANSNPIVLNSAGQCPSGVYGTTGAYKLVLAPSTDSDPPLSPIWTQDGVAGVNDVAATPVDQWISSSLTPTYVSATQFTVPGDNTATLNVGRRLKTQNTVDTTYSRITGSSFGAGVTTVTVASVSGTLDSGLSSVAYGIISGTNQSQPDLDTEVRGVTQASTENSTKLATTAWARLGAVSALSLVQGPVSVSGATADFTTGFDGTYNSLLFILEGVQPATNGVSLYVRISLDGSTFRSTAGDYQHVRYYMDPATAIASTGSTSATEVIIAGTASVSNQVVLPLDGHLWVHNVASTTADKGLIAEVSYFSSGGSATADQRSSGHFVATQGALKGIRFLFSGGNISAGKITVYGLRIA